MTDKRTSSAGWTRALPRSIYAMKGKLEKVGECYMCGQGAAWNTPTLDRAGRLVCPTCSENSLELLTGIEQHTLDGEYWPNGRFFKRGIVLWYSDEPKVVHAWFDNGRIVAPLSDVERRMQPEPLCNALANEWYQGIRRCTLCETTIRVDDVGGYPLFAGLACKKCWTEWCKGAKTDRSCTLCGQPMRFCSC